MAIDRRAFLGRTAALGALSIMPGGLAKAATAPEIADTPWRAFEITTRIEVVAPEGAAKAWVPLPSVSGHDWIKPLGNTWHIEGGAAAERRVGPYGVDMVAATWPAGTKAPILEVVSRVATRDRAIDLSNPGNAKDLNIADRKLFTSATQLIPVDGIVKQTAEGITAGATSDVDKAKRIYDWMVANTFRDPKTRGCGIGDISAMLKTGNLGGKCADLNALYVGLARAAGLPARDLYGIRVAASRQGYKSLGANSETITKAQHCRAEVFLSGFGWVPVDPADVRKFVLEEPPGNLPLDSDAVNSVRQALFGSWETNWIAYNQGHDVALPGAQEPPLGFLMYPQVATTAGHRDCLDPDACKYTISAKEIRLDGADIPA